MKIIEFKYNNSIICRLNALTKLITLILLSIITMITYDTRILLSIFIFSIIVLKLSRINIEQIKIPLYVMIGFLFINLITIYIISPQEGTNIYGTYTPILKDIGYYSLTREQLFYFVNIILKYISVAPLVLVFFITTNSSKLGVSLYKLKIPYSICYAISLAFRYIETIQEDFVNIKRAKEARGMDFSDKTSLRIKIKNVIRILVPLLMINIAKIDTISTAMELRGFGRNKNRTWYMDEKLSYKDILLIILIISFTIIYMYIMIKYKKRVYNPFRGN